MPTPVVPASAACVAGEVDAASGLAAVGVVLTDSTGVPWDCELNLLDLSKHHDKYYNLQASLRAVGVGQDVGGRRRALKCLREGRRREKSGKVPQGLGEERGEQGTSLVTA